MESKSVEINTGLMQSLIRSAHCGNEWLIAIAINPG